MASLKLETESVAGPPMYDGIVATSSKASLFYRGVVLLGALLDTQAKPSSSSKRRDMAIPPESEAVDIFQSFVSKLCHICDSRPAGHTVTAGAVLDLPDKILYVFASNNRRSTELQTVHAYLDFILKNCRHIPSLGNDEMREAFMENLLRDVLVFNRERVRCYLSGLSSSLDICSRACEKDTAQEAGQYKKMFLQLLTAVDQTKAADMDEDEFFEHMKMVLNGVNRLQEFTTAIFIQERSSNDQAGNTEPWQLLRHHSGRLLAYHRSVEVLWIAGKMWPQLFRDFEVLFIPSSTKHLNPLSKVEFQEPSMILSRLLPAGAKEMSQSLVQDLQKVINLGDIMRKQWSSPSFKPRVHAEILVLNCLEQLGGIRFFNNWQYIGCSKPTCRLCEYYIVAHASGIKVRSTHGNLYESWRFPDHADVYGCRTEAEALAARQKMMSQVLDRIRDDIKGILREQISGGRRFDSATLSSFPNAETVIEKFGNGGSSMARWAGSRIAPSYADSLIDGWDSLQADGDSGDGGGPLDTPEDTEGTPRPVKMENDFDD